jgi:hypothetical protein
MDRNRSPKHSCNDDDDEEEEEEQQQQQQQLGCIPVRKFLTSID